MAIDDVVMSCGFLADGVRERPRRRLGPRHPPALRGRARAARHGRRGKLAEPMLDERFLMLNGDVLTDIDLTAQIAQHESSGARATLALVPVAGPVRLRPGDARRGARGHGVRGEADARPQRPEPDQRRRLRAGARDPGPRAPRAQRLDRARGLAPARRRRAVWLPQRALLDGHRHPLALPAGHLRHHRGQRQDGAARSPRRRLARGR